MKMRVAQWMGIGVLAIGLAGCSKGPKDTSQVLVDIAGQKITQARFEEVVKILVNDPKQAEELLKSDAMKEQRNQLLDSMALQKAIIETAKAEGLDKDTETQFVLEQTTAQLYLKTLMERRIKKSTDKLEPTDAELKALYDQGVAQRKAAGQTKDIPSFEQVKPQLAEGWIQNKRQEKNEAEFKAMVTEMRTKFPMTYAEGYKPTPQPGQP